jgi:flagellar basal body rod protein FlgG
MTIAGIGMQNDLQRMNSIGQNLANVLTSGYKREIPVTKSFDSHVQEASGAAAVTDAPTVDTTAGALRATANPLDVAIDGDGFFEVMTEQGPAYTRQGAFRTDVSGRLVTAQGLAVMGTGGEITLPTGLPVTIERNGDVRQADRIIGRIKLVHFENAQALSAIGNGLFSQGGAQFAESAASGVVRAGYQESSNVNSSQEMVRLTETMRHFEAMQKIMQGYDDSFDKAVRKLGEF